MNFVIRVCEFEGLCVGEFYEYEFLRNDKQSALFIRILCHSVGI